MSEDLKKELDNIENRVWKTYQSRIKCATRLLNNSKFLECISIIYSVVLAIASVISIMSQDKIFILFNAIISIILLGLIIYGNTQNYKDRYIRMKENYLKMSDLYYSILKTKENKLTIDDFKEVYSKYNTLLDVVENHTEFDYFCYVMSEDEKKLDCSKKKYYYWEKVKQAFYKLFILIIPILFLAYIFIKIVPHI